MMNINRQTIALLFGAVLLSTGALWAAPPEQGAPPPFQGRQGEGPGKMGRRPGKGPGMMRPGMRPGAARGAAMWRAFSLLDEAERKKMLELQRNDPDKFFAEMRRLSAEFEKQEQARLKKLQCLIDKYRTSTDKAERERLKTELTKMERAQFDKRIAGLTRTVESTKRRLALMEQGLKERKEKADAIVDARVEALLSGEIPVAPAYPAPHMRQGPPRQGPPRQGPPRQ